MIRRHSLILSIGVSLVALTMTSAKAQFAAEVLSYDPGTVPVGGYTNPATALGSPERFTGEGSFPGAVTMFNPPFGNSEIVAISESGHLTLRLSHYALPDSTGPEIGVFGNVLIVDEDYPNSQAGDPLFAFGIDNAVVEVSEDGLSWESLGISRFDIPTQGYSDIAGTLESNFQQPFTGVLTDFTGLRLDDPANPDILDLLGGSGGGTWLDISGLSLTKVGYIRFSTPAGFDLNLQLDAVSISAAAMGGRVPEPTTFVMLGLAIVSAGTMRRK